ncbi:MAG: alcohol dehydrogenase catalytic domain-containing protein [Acidobacteriota bacterium]|nr:alcohol dehydrogenase catalytic domain-containing protein [Acidobacteriota bacterium]
MQALQFQSGHAAVVDLPIPRPRPGFALVRVLLSGICNTDLELKCGYHCFSGVPGHEFVGMVEGPKGSPWLGRRVVGEINLGCGRCGLCRSGMSRHCPRRRVLGIVRHPGAHAEFLTLPESNLREVPPGVSDEEAVFTEPLAAACEILDQVAVSPETRAAVVGAGKLGLLVAQVLENSGALVTKLGRDSRARKQSFDLVVEATGSPAGMPRALELVRPRGTIIWKSTHHAPARFDAAPLVVNEVTVVGSRCGRFEPALELLRTRKIDLSKMISAEFPLAQASKALALASRRGVRKVLLAP